MSDLGKNIKNTSDKLSGQTKELIGKVTNNQELELKGKIQSSMADFNKKTSDIKNDTAEKVNDIIDKHNSEENK
jgi:uncharacterized protein YjbJ (UPF0337 family)